MVYKTQIRLKMKQFSFTRTNMNMLLLVQLLLVGTISASAQDFGVDPDKCKENLSLYREYYKQKNYQDALIGWRWVFTNCPSSTKNIVINGPKIVEHQIEKNKKNPEAKQAYIDTLMMVYDKRIELFPGDKGYALGKKGMDQYEYAGEDYTPAYNTLTESMKVDGLETDAYVLMRLYTAGMKRLVDKQIEMDVMYELYDEISTILDAQLKKFVGVDGAEDDKDYKKLMQAKDVVDQNFERIAKEDQYIALMQPKIEESPADAGLLEKVTNMMVKRSWTSNPFYLDASEKLYKIAPSTVAAYNLYEGHMKKGNSTEGAKFLQESIKLEADNNEKAVKLLKLAKVYGSQKNYSKARSTANEAAGLKAGWGEPFMFIGDLYLSTASSCGTTPCDSRYGIWAAEDMFIKAKSDANIASEANGKIASCKKYYPVAKDCFFEGVKAGDKVKVGGWIGVETTARIAD